MAILMKQSADDANSSGECAMFSVGDYIAAGGAFANFLGCKGRVVIGYSGGHKRLPSYDDVSFCSHIDDHRHLLQSLKE